MGADYLTRHKAGKWAFNEDVAKSFSVIAKKNIPHYKIVIEKGVQIAKRLFPNNFDIKIIDVGSATGNTIEAFLKAGFKNVFGVENSPIMMKYSLHKKRVILSEHFPLDKKYFDMVVANWTVHFIDERYKYLKDIYKSLHKNGYLILTDQVSSSQCVFDMYHDFKRKQGVPEDEIARKAAAVKGILVTKPLSWYLSALKKIGFSEVEVIDADWRFVTMLCRK